MTLESSAFALCSALLFAIGAAQQSGDATSAASPSASAAPANDDDSSARTVATVLIISAVILVFIICAACQGFNRHKKLNTGQAGRGMRDTPLEISNISRQRKISNTINRGGTERRYSRRNSDATFSLTKLAAGISGSPVVSRRKQYDSNAAEKLEEQAAAIDLENEKIAHPDRFKTMDSFSMTSERSSGHGVPSPLSKTRSGKMRSSRRERLASSRCEIRMDLKKFFLKKRIIIFFSYISLEKELDKNRLRCRP